LLCVFVAKSVWKPESRPPKSCDFHSPIPPPQKKHTQEGELLGRVKALRPASRSCILVRAWWSQAENPQPRPSEPCDLHSLLLTTMGSGLKALRALGSSSGPQFSPCQCRSQCSVYSSTLKAFRGQFKVCMLAVPENTYMGACGTTGKLPGPQTVKHPIVNSSSQYIQKLP
jgi:hypothetical protein